MIEKIVVPSNISKEVSRYDNGFLISVLNNCETGEVVMGDEAIGLLEDFGNLHSRVMCYFTNLNDEWKIGNYAYESVRFLNHPGQLKGKIYHVTGLDGTRCDGENDFFSNVDLEKGDIVVPSYFDYDMKGLFLGRKIERGDEKYNLRFLVGDNFSDWRILEMPVFRGKGPECNLGNRR